MIRLHALAFAIVCVTVAACAREQAPSYDLVIANGRVIDPESGLDARAPRRHQEREDRGHVGDAARRASA